MISVIIDNKWIGGETILTFSVENSQEALNLAKDWALENRSDFTSLTFTTKE